MNKVILGDCLTELPKLDKESVDLIYLDPPFFTQTVQKLKNKEGVEFSFNDNWKNIEAYTEYIIKRLAECKRVLKDTGSIFLHCDKSASHYLRVALDKVFGASNFQSEIIWTYKRWSNSKKGLLNAHQNIYFYSKTKEFKFNTLYTDYSPTTNIDQILQKRVRNKEGKTSYMKDENNSDVIDSNKKGVPMSDVWDIPYLNPKAKERVGYPTQKPILLLERIIEMATNENDIVLDPFCGSGTTLLAAKLLNRNYVGFDKSQEAISLVNERLLNPFKTESHLLKKGKKSYQNKTEEELELLKSLNATPVQRNSGIDGFLKNTSNGTPVSVKIQKDTEDSNKSIEKLINASIKKKCRKMIFVTSDRASIKEEYLTNKNLVILDNHFFILKTLEDKA